MLLRWTGFAALSASVIVLVSTSVNTHRRHRLQLNALRLNKETLEDQWRVLSQISREAQQVQPHFDRSLRGVQRLTDDLTRRGWTPALQILGECLQPEIELRNIHVTGEPGTGFVCTIRLEGECRGRFASEVVENFRQQLVRKLAEQFHAEIASRFHGQVEAPGVPALNPDSEKTAFSLEFVVLERTQGGHGE